MKFFTLFLLSLFSISNSFAQLVLERDINQEPAPSYPSYFTELNGTLYFSADDGINGSELYSYDLSSETAQIIANIQPFEVGSSINQVITFDNKIYFNAKDGGGNNTYMFVHDPSDNSTQRLIDSENEDIKNPANFFEFNGQLFFAAEFPNIGTEVGRYDPSTNTIEILADINTSGDSYPNFFNEANGQLWFAANDGQGDSRLWRYDPMTGSVEKIMYTTPDELYPSMSFLYHFDGQFFFRGFLQGQGEELYIYDIATNALLDFPEIYSGPGSSSPSGFIAFDDKLYFVARTASAGREVRIYDPATNEITLLADINPAGNGNAGDFLILNDQLYFTANVNDTDRHLFSYDADNEALIQEATLDNNGSSNWLSTLIIADGSIFLSGAKTETSTELFRFTPGNSAIDLAADINATTVGSDPYQFTSYNGKLYFGADEVNSGREIWVYDPATGNVDILSDTPGSLNPEGFTVLDGKLFFSGIHPDEGYGLLYYDDATGVISATDLITPSYVGHINYITAYNGLLYFKADDETVGRELHVYNPDLDAYDVVADIFPSSESSNPENLFVFEDELYFEADDGLTGKELWKFNATTEETTQVADLNPGADDSNPGWFTAYDGELYFSAFVEGQAYNLYSYNPTTGDLTQRTDISGNLNPQSLAVYNDKLFFNGRYSSSVNAELVYYDAATNETVLTEDLNPNASNPRDLTVFNDKLYFATFTDEYGRELWEYNDTSLSIVADIYSGIPGSDPTDLQLFNGKLYLAANDGLVGSEIWSIAECLNIFVDTEPQAGNNGTGLIDLTINGGSPPYSISWSNGATTEDIDNLQAGIYTATISDASGCLSEITAEVTFTNSISNILAEDLISIFPNPNSGSFVIDLGTLASETAAIFNLSGQLIYQKTLPKNITLIDINLQYAPGGLYLLKVYSKEGIVIKKLIVD